MGSGTQLHQRVIQSFDCCLGNGLRYCLRSCFSAKIPKKIVLLNQDEITIRFFKNLGSYNVLVTKTVAETIQHIKQYVGMNQALSHSSPINSPSFYEYERFCGFPNGLQFFLC
jgi:hypothetical protein